MMVQCIDTVEFYPDTSYTSLTSDYQRQRHLISVNAVVGQAGVCGAVLNPCPTDLQRLRHHIHIVATFRHKIDFYTFLQPSYLQVYQLGGVGGGLAVECDVIACVDNFRARGCGDLRSVCRSQKDGNSR